jgi:hypothetical protein
MHIPRLSCKGGSCIALRCTETPFNLLHRQYLAYHRCQTHTFTILSMGYVCSCMIYLHDKCRFTQERSSKGEASQGNQDNEGISLLVQPACRNRYLPGAYPVPIRCLSGAYPVDKEQATAFPTSFSHWRHRWRKCTGSALGLYGPEAIRRARDLGLCLSPKPSHHTGRTDRGGASRQVLAVSRYGYFFERLFWPNVHADWP